ncbi:GMP synthase [Colletotrichum higginsianum]|nr:GMP synthase [Colletotrichum higginsianum]
MSNFGNFMKNGWHPEKAGTTFKGQVNGLLGRNKDDDKEDRVAPPLSSLKDPSTFAPPPKRVPGAPPPRSNAASPSPGAPPPPYEDPSRQQQQQQEEEEEAPPRPYRVNTTGLSTSHLPPPPGRKDGADGRTPSPGQAAARPPPPSLPPRLPPRTPSATSVTSPAPPAPAASGGYLNQNAMNRLGAAGVSVPALGIGKPAPEPPTRSNAGSPAPPPPRNGAFSPPSGQMGELQNRFAKLGRSTGQSSSPPPPPAEGTTMEQKQAALRTASNFHKNPSTVSMADARSAASTFNNFRQRHGEQVASGVKSANNLNQKYGISDKIGHYAGRVGQQQEGTTGNAGAAPSPLSPPPGLVSAIGKKKPPPPPPKKKPQLSSAPAAPPGQGDDDEPPPIPLATKPTF